MAKSPSNSSVSEPTGQGVGTPASRPNDITLVEIAKIQSDGEYIKRDLTELKTDMRDMRDRMSKLEVKVDHLPSKGFIIVTVSTALIIVNGLVLLISKMLSLPIANATGH